MRCRLMGGVVTLVATMATVAVLWGVSAHAGTVIKADNTTNLNDPLSWVGGAAVPGMFDIAQWDATVTAPNTTDTLGADMTWGGIKITNPGGAVDIASGNTLTVGPSGIDLSSATQNLTLDCGLTLQGYQQWKAAAGRTLNVAGPLATTGAVVSFTNFSSTATLGTLSNDGSGILGPWAITGTGTNMQYAKNTAGTVSAFTTQTAGTAGTLANVTDPNVNYSKTGAAILTGDIAANTLRVTDATALDNTGRSMTLNGLMFTGSGWLGDFGKTTANGGGDLIIGANRNVVIIGAGGNNPKVVARIVDNPSGPSSVTVYGSNSGEWNFAGVNTYTGGTTLNYFEQINVNNTKSFGTGPITINGTGSGNSRLANIAAGCTNPLTLNGATMMGNWSGPVTLVGTLTSFGYQGENSTMDAKVSGSGGFNKYGAGSYTFTNAANDFTGKITVRGGTLAFSKPLSNVGVAGPLGAATGDNAVIDLWAGSRLQYNGGQGITFDTNRPLNLGGSTTGTVYLNGANVNDTNFYFRGAITATGTGARTLQIESKGDRPVYVYQSGIPDMSDGSKVSLSLVWSSGSSRDNGIINLAGVNTFTGPITLTGGSHSDADSIGNFLIGGSGNVSGNVLHVTPGGTAVLGNGNYAGNITFTSGTAASVLLYFASNANQILSGAISGPGALTMGGAGTLTLSGVNSYTRSTSVVAGTLEITGAGQLGCGLYAANIPISSGATLKFNSTADQELSGTVTNAGSLVKDNTGLLTLSGANSGAGATTVSGGILRLANASALSTGLLTVGGGAVELAAGDLQRNLGTGAGQVQVSAGTSGFSAYGADRTVTLGTAGDSLLWGSSSFAPATLLLNAPTANKKLTLNNGIDLNGETRTIAVSAAADYLHTSAAEITGAVVGTGGVNKIGAGTLLLSGDNTYNGPTNVTGGELAVKGTLKNTLSVDGATITPTIGSGSLTVGSEVASGTAMSMSGASNFRWEIGAAGTSNVVVHGDLSITGTPTLKVTSIDGTKPVASTVYDVITYTGNLVAQADWGVPDLSPINANTIWNWQGGTGNWDTVSKWDGGACSGGTITYNATRKTVELTGISYSGTTPRPTTDVRIMPSGGAAATGPAAATPINSLQLGNGADPISLTIQASAPLTVAGATTVNHATLTLNDTMTTMSVTSSGTSLVNGSGNLGTSVAPLSTFTIASGTTSFGGTATVRTNALAVGGTATLNSGSTVVTKGLSGAGSINFDGGTLKAAGDLKLSTVPATIKSGGAIIDSGGNKVTIEQVFSADPTDGGLTVQGGGSFEIKKTQTYTGPTTIHSGTTLKLISGPADGSVLWLNAADTSKMTFATGNAITAWASSSGSAGTVSGNGTYTPNVINGQPVVRMTNAQMMYNTVNYTSPCTIFAVERLYDTSGASRVIGGYSNNWLFGYHGNQMNRFYFEGWVNGDTNGIAVTTAPQFYEATIAGAGQNSTVYKYNTTTSSMQQLASNTGGTKGPNGLELNGYNNGGEKSYADVAEVLIYSGILSDELRAQTEAYLMGKYWGSGPAGGALPTTTAVNLAANAILNLNGVNQEVASLADAAGSPTGHQILLGKGTLTVSGSAATAFSGAISGTGGLNKNGSGTLTLQGANTYTGKTTVSQGTLLVNNTSGSGTGSGQVTVAAGATLGGTGAIGSYVEANGILSPGASVGLLTINNDLDMVTATSTLLWQLGLLKDDNDANQRGVAYDGLNVVGTLGLGVSSIPNGTPDTPMAQLTLAFAAGLAPDEGNGFWNSDHSWKLIDVTGSNAGSLAFASITNDYDGKFSTFVGDGTTGDADDVYLQYIGGGIQPGNGTWTNAAVGNSNWSDGGNWTGGHPIQAGNVATFDAMGGGGQVDVDDVNGVTIGGMTFNTTTPYTIGVNGGNTVMLQVAGGSATITDTAGNHEIAAPLSLGSATSVDVADTYNLTLSGAVTGENSLTKTGPGTLTLTNSGNDYASTTVTGGTLVIGSAGALPAGKSLSIGSGGTLVLGGGMAMGTAASAEPVPEPGTLALLAIAALAGVMIWRKKRD